MSRHEHDRSGVPILPSLKDSLSNSAGVEARRLSHSRVGPFFRPRRDYEINYQLYTGGSAPCGGTFTGTFPNGREACTAGQEAMKDLELSLQHPHRLHVQRTSQREIHFKQPLNAYRGATYRVVEVKRGEDGGVTLREILRGSYRNSDEARAAAQNLLEQRKIEEQKNPLLAKAS